MRFHIIPYWIYSSTSQFSCCNHWKAESNSKSSYSFVIVYSRRSKCIFNDVKIAVLKLTQLRSRGWPKPDQLEHLRPTSDRLFINLYKEERTARHHFLDTSESISFAQTTKFDFARVKCTAATCRFFLKKTDQTQDRWRDGPQPGAVLRRGAMKHRAPGKSVVLNDFLDLAR